MHICLVKFIWANVETELPIVPSFRDSYWFSVYFSNLFPKCIFLCFNKVWNIHFASFLGKTFTWPGFKRNKTVSCENLISFLSKLVPTQALPRGSHSQILACPFRCILYTSYQIYIYDTHVMIVNFMHHLVVWVFFSLSNIFWKSFHLSPMVGGW